VFCPVYRVAATILAALMAVSCAADAPLGRGPTVAPKPTPPHLVGSPEEAAREVRANVTSVAPLLLPTAFPAPMTALVTLGDDSFSVMYMDESMELRIHIGIVAANPSPPQGNEAQVQLAFRSDPRAVRRIDNATNPRSLRYVVWNEPAQKLPGSSYVFDVRCKCVPYVLSTEGLTEAQFAKVAASLADR